jgi:hypothetical protein
MEVESKLTVENGNVAVARYWMPKNAGPVGRIADQMMAATG